MLVSCPISNMAFRPAAAGSVGCFSRRERSAHIWFIRVERATRKNSQLTDGPEGCDENGPAAVPRLRDRLRIDLDMRPLPPVRLGPPCRRPILIATKATLFMGQDTCLDCRLTGPKDCRAAACSAERSKRLGNAIWSAYENFGLDQSPR